MSDLVEVKMLRDVGGFAAGAKRKIRAADAERLAKRGVVEIVKAAAATRPRKTANARTTQSKSTRRTQAAPALKTKG
jgi:hypothetical protein